VRLPVAISRRLRIAAIVVLGSVVVYSTWTAGRAWRMYGFVKSNQAGWTSQVHAYDRELGFAPIPGSRGAEILALGPDVPMRYDENGFRVPLDAPASKRRPLVLSLGCSWTYGAACLAEEAYPFLVASALNGSSLNAGVPSYGLAQMLLLARRLVPRHRPDVVIVPHAEWLVQRAQAPFAPTTTGLAPTPFLFQDGTGRLRIHAPVFPSLLFELPFSSYRTTPRGGADFASFLSRVGLPLLVHDDLQMTLHQAWSLGGIVPRPCPDRDLIVRTVYAEIGELSRANNARAVIVLLGPSPSSSRLAALAASKALIVDAQAALCGRLPGGCPDPMPFAGQAYRAAYGHWRGSPPVFVDPHPNPRAHAVIAGAIVAALRAAGK
jgi:hypothetical protein